MTILRRLFPAPRCGHAGCAPRYCRFKVGEIAQAVQYDLTRCTYDTKEQCVCTNRRCTRLPAC